MTAFLEWFNAEQPLDPVIKAAIAHLWFVSIHPFDDGNGRIGRAILDVQLTRSDNSPRRFYSMSSQILAERNKYYEALENTQGLDGDITDWLDWFLNCLRRAIQSSEATLARILQKADFWERHAAAGFNSRQRLMLGRLLEGFKGNLTSVKWAKITKSSPDTALRDIQDLVGKGILRKSAAGGRSTNYELVL
jgi:Fic family protein